MTSLFSDDFNRANGAVGNGWTSTGTTVDILSNELRSVTAGSADAGIYRAGPAADVFITITLRCVTANNANTGIWISARTTDTTAGGLAAGYSVYWNASTLYLYRGSTVLGTSTIANLPGGSTHTVGLYCIGTSIKAYYDGSPVITATDSTYTSANNVRVWGQAGDFRYDDYNIEDSGTQNGAVVMAGVATLTATAVDLSASAVLNGLATMTISGSAISSFPALMRTGPIIIGHS